MPRLCQVLNLLILLGLVSVGSVRAETYSDPTGFTCTSPEGWELLNGSRVGDVEGALSPSAQQWIRDNRIDFSQIKVILLRNGDSQGFLENINVVVESGQVLVSEAMRQHLSTVVPKKYADAGLTVTTFQNRIATIGGRASIVSDYQLTFPNSTGVVTVRQRQYVVPGGGQTFTITCTALPETFDVYESTFAAFAETFQVPAPTAAGINWGAVLKSGAIWGILGGLIGGIAGAKLVKKRIKQQEPPDNG